jgi:hypothetical protein
VTSIPKEAERLPVGITNSTHARLSENICQLFSEVENVGGKERGHIHPNIVSGQ